MTGEEKESNVLQISCKLFLFQEVSNEVKSFEICNHIHTSTEMRQSPCCVMQSTKNGNTLFDKCIIPELSVLCLVSG